MATTVQVVIDCADPASLAAFWAEALRYEIEPPPPGFASWQAWVEQSGAPRERWNDASAIVDPDGVGPRIFFQRVPEPKTVKNRVHLDVHVGDRSMQPEERQALAAAEVERLVALGASIVEADRTDPDFGGRWTVLQDPEGNEFCV